MLKLSIKATKTVSVCNLSNNNNIWLVILKIQIKGKVLVLVLRTHRDSDSKHQKGIAVIMSIVGIVIIRIVMMKKEKV